MQSGSALYLAIIVMIILLAIVLGLTAILVGQMKMVREMGYSVIALSAADAGIEKALTEWGGDPASLDGLSYTLSNDATYEIIVLKGELIAGGPEGHCTVTGLSYCITSVGTYPSQGVKRAIEIAY